MTAARTNILSELRASTAASHQSLESLPLLARLLAKDLKEEEYQQFIRKTYILHKNVEEKAFAALKNHFPGLEERKKSHLLAADLRAMKQNEVPYLDLFNSGYRSNPAFNLGLLYVTEGSTLGGQVILRSIKESIGTAAVSFLNAYGANTGSMWKKLVHELTEFSQKHGEEAEREIIKGANYGFEQARKLYTS